MLQPNSTPSPSAQKPHESSSPSYLRKRDRRSESTRHCFPERVL
jgi:hypothetical protein